MALYNYKIWTNDGLIEKEDAQEIKHVDAKAAVEEFAETQDQQGDFYFANNTSTDVIILCEDEEGKITQWNMAVEAVPQYYATEIFICPHCNKTSKSPQWLKIHTCNVEDLPPF